MSQQAIEVSHVSKSFRVYYDRGHTLKETLLFRRRNRYERRQILRDISFSVSRGEAVGVIGHNGCGKSTLLKLLTRIMYPDEGSVQIQGRVACLIELGAGFHPDMSGRENIFINASIFGLSRKEIESRLDAIIAFSELGDFIDNPVRTYSSGMYMRLAFSIAINVNADVLLVDEILAVGDEAFQKKCYKKMQELKRSGITILMVTHNLEVVKTFCDRAIWIHDGVINASGAPKEVVSRYLYAVDSGQLSQGLDRNTAESRTVEAEDLEKVAADRGRFELCMHDYHFDLGRWVLGGFDKNGRRTLMPNGVSYGPYISLLPGEYLISLETEQPEMIEEKCSYAKGQSQLPSSRLGVYDSCLLYYMNLGFPVDNWEVQIHNRSTEIRVPIWNLRIWKKGSPEAFAEKVHDALLPEGQGVALAGNEDVSMGCLDHLDMGMYLWQVDAQAGADLQGTVLANSGNITFHAERQPESGRCRFLFVCPTDLDKVEFRLENLKEEETKVFSFRVMGNGETIQ